MQVTDREKDRIKVETLLFGYNTHETDYFDTPLYSKLRTTMLDDLPNQKNKEFNFGYLAKSKMLEAGKFVIDKHFGKSDLRVPFANGDDMESQLLAIFGPNPTNDKYDEIIQYINNQIELVRVTDIPVILNIDKSKDGHVSTTWFYDKEVMDDRFYKKLQPCVRDIVIEGPCDEDSICTYVHEMAHALINRHKGNISNLLHTELFSIFMEKVAARDIEEEGNLLEIETFIRLSMCKHNLLDRELCELHDTNYLDFIADNTYLLSTVQATALFDTYSKGSNKLRQEMDDSLSDVISGDRVLEDVLNQYEATLEKGTKIMRRQIKQYQKKFKE